MYRAPLLLNEQSTVHKSNHTEMTAMDCLGASHGFFRLHALVVVISCHEWLGSISPPVAVGVLENYSFDTADLRETTSVYRYLQPHE